MIDYVNTTNRKLIAIRTNAGCSNCDKFFKLLNNTIVKKFLDDNNILCIDNKKYEYVNNRNKSYFKYTGGANGIDEFTNHGYYKDKDTNEKIIIDYTNNGINSKITLNEFPFVALYQKTDTITRFKNFTGTMQKLPYKKAEYTDVQNFIYTCCTVFEIPFNPDDYLK